MISTDVRNQRRAFGPALGLCRALIGAALLAGIASAAFAQESDEYTVRVTAVGGGGRLMLSDEPARPGSEQAIFSDFGVESRLTGPVDGRRAILNIGQPGVTVVVSILDLDLKRREEGGLDINITPSDTPGGWVDIYHQLDKPIVRITLPNAFIGLPRGIVRIRQVDDGFEVAAAEGRVAVGTMGGGEKLLASDGANTLHIAADGTLSDPQTVAGVGDTLAANRGVIVQSSLLPEFVRVAEAVAEGDIEPPTRAARAPAVAVAPVVRIKEIVPRGGVASRIIGSSRGAATAGGARQSTAEVFIGSGQAALAVVGARLQRTRVVGAAPGSRPPLAISSELSRLFSLGRAP